MMKKFNIQFVPTNIDNHLYFQLIDSIDGQLKKGRVKRMLGRYKSYFKDYDHLLIDSKINYVLLQEVIDRLNFSLIKVGFGSIEVDPRITDHIRNNKYAIKEHQAAGSTIKFNDKRWADEIITFERILNREIFSGY